MTALLIVSALLVAVISGTVVGPQPSPTPLKPRAVIRALERATDPLFRQAGLSLD